VLRSTSASGYGVNTPHETVCVLDHLPLHSDRCRPGRVWWQSERSVSLFRLGLDGDVIKVGSASIQLGEQVEFVADLNGVVIAILKGSMTTNTLREPIGSRSESGWIRLPRFDGLCSTSPRCSSSPSTASASSTCQR
jgi:hypothetical protein